MEPVNVPMPTAISAERVPMFYNQTGESTHSSFFHTQILFASARPSVVGAVLVRTLLSLQ